MNATHPVPWSLLLALALVPRLAAADSAADFSYVVRETDIAQVKAADDARLAALLARDRAGLEAVLSADLRYARADGTVDDFASHLDRVMDGTQEVGSHRYRERDFASIAPGVVLMTGRVAIGPRDANEPSSEDLRFLAVWRDEDGQWRLRAWQESRPVPESPAAPPPTGG